MSGAFAEGSFTWILGIEDTCVYPADGATLDEHELTGHTEHWRDDLRLARDLGATAIRYGMSWPLVHVARGEFDWSVLDEVIPFAVDELGLTIVADLVHYGTPGWLADAFADPGYPSAIAEFAGALAHRYRQWLHHFTPLNEPLTTASFCGLRGVWPPHRTGWDGWVSVAVPIALGISLAAKAIRDSNPDARLVHVEASTLILPSDEGFEEHSEFLRQIGWLPTDLAAGLVNSSHPMWTWLVERGAGPTDLDWLVKNPARFDLLGVNYYPDLTPRLIVDVGGRLSQLSRDGGAEGLELVLRAFADRYRRPLVVTETSIEGSDESRSAWVVESTRAVARLVRSGVDIRGYTWWPLFDFVDWSWASGGRNVEEFIVAAPTVDGGVAIAPAPSLGNPEDGKSAFLRRMGLIRLEEQADGGLHRVPTPASATFALQARQPGGAHPDQAGPHLDAPR